MNAKKIIIFILVVGLISFEGYLVVSLFLGKTNQDKDVHNFCVEKCNYNPNSLYWEFSGDINGVKGFTTEDECFSYCTRARQGFAYFITNYAPAFISNLFGNLFSSLKLK